LGVRHRSKNGEARTKGVKIKMGCFASERNTATGHGSINGFFPELFLMTRQVSLWVE
jgi:hypothetical protein